MQAYFTLVARGSVICNQHDKLLELGHSHFFPCYKLISLPHSQFTLPKGPFKDTVILIWSITTHKSLCPLVVMARSMRRMNTNGKKLMP